ncbi:MAG TPA: tripartite tricarboxylate transporter substrate binding protein [Ramlibacter sp.]|nr:tripartite tricarboxylate transporter substrate binding protein [Ramlibacter sp.]
MSVSRRSFVASLALASSVPAFADAPYPDKPVKFINSFPPGGPSDILARAIGEVLTAQLHQTFVIENKAGASGNIGADAVAKAQADGYTVLVGIDTTLTVNPHIYKTMPFKPADLKPVMIMASSGLLVGVNPHTGFKTMKDLVAGAKSKSLTFSSAGAGSPGHLAIAVFDEATGAKLTHVPYKGNTPAVVAVLSGEVDGGILATPGMLPHVKAGKISALAVTSRQRSKLAPDIPTVSEAGIPALEQEVFYLMSVPAATPDAVVQVLQKAVADALARPELQSRMLTLDLQYEGLTGAAASKRLADLSDHYARVIKATGLKVE